MGNRILSKEECELLLPEAIQVVYQYLHNQYYSSEVIEKALLQAMILARMNQCRIDAPTISFLLDRIAENEGTPIFDTDVDCGDFMNRYY